LETVQADYCKPIRDFIQIASIEEIRLPFTVVEILVIIFVKNIIHWRRKRKHRISSGR
jgi:hypothetical protein